MENLFSEQRIAGLLLILAFIAFAAGAGLPTLGEKGNMNIYTLPTREYLTTVAGNSDTWRWANILMGSAIVLLMLGLTTFTTSLEGSGERILSRIGMIGMLISAILWVIFSAFRATVTINAAQEMAATGSIPSYYEPTAQWGFGLFYAYAVIGFLALAAYAVSVLQTGLLSGWVGWVALVFSLAMLALHLITGDTLPAFHYLPPLLIGIMLMIRG